VQSLDPAATALARFRYATAANRVLIAGERFRRVLKAGFRPDEPRVPAGNPDGGQWTDGGGGGLSAGTEQDVDPIVTGGTEDEDPRHYSVDLREEESAGGHTIQDHVGRSPQSLLARVRGERYLGIFETIARYRDGSFPSIQAANKLVDATLSRNKEIVDAVANGTLSGRKLITATFTSKTGIEAFRKGEYEQPYIRDTYGVGVVIIHDPGNRSGYRVVTAYPRND